ncbi:DNA-binding domain-containing protein [Sinomicrobium sp. M5D2P9]
MPLEYYLIPNQMTPDPDDYMAVSSNTRSMSIEDVYEQMTREGSTITKAEALANFEEITQGIIGLVRQGYSVVTPLVNITSGISGVFTSEDDSFDSLRHQVRIRVNTGLRLKQATSAIPVKKVASRQRQPAPVHYYDNTAEAQNEMITPGGGARVTGSLLKFDEADTEQGIFFINVADNTTTRVAGKLLRNKPGELIFLNPELPSGTYRLEVRSILDRGISLIKGTLPHELSIV